MALHRQRGRRGEAQAVAQIRIDFELSGPNSGPKGGGVLVRGPADGRKEAPSESSEKENQPGRRRGATRSKRARISHWNPHPPSLPPPLEGGNRGGRLPDRLTKVRIVTWGTPMKRQIAAAASAKPAAARKAAARKGAGPKPATKPATPKRANRPSALEAALAAKLNVADFEAAAAKKMPRPWFDYYAGGAEDERTLARNRAAMDRWVLLHRVLVDVSHVDLASTALGES